MQKIYNYTIMKKILLCLLCSLFLGHGVMAIANNSDTLQWITNVSQIIENATPIETSQLDWESIWTVDEWQRVEYMPQQGNYKYFHKQHEQIQIFQNQIEIEGYSILLNGYTESLIEIKHQQVDGIYGENEYVSGKLTLIDDELYLHLRIVGAQDYAVDLYAVGVRTSVSALCDRFDPILPSKLLRDGQLIIRHGKTIYNAQGVLIK